MLPFQKTLSILSYSMYLVSWYPPLYTRNLMKVELKNMCNHREHIAYGPGLYAIYDVNNARVAQLNRPNKELMHKGNSQREALSLFEKI